MNVLLASRYDELVARLALGIEPVDAVTGRRISVPVSATVDPADLVAPRRGQAFERHSSARFALRYARLTTPPIVVRLDDPARRFVPRRIRFPFSTQAEMLELERTGDPLARLRGRRPVLFPGPAYPLLGATTAIRGRVTRASKPVRWARVAAHTPPPSSVLLGLGQSDDHGEFVLILGTNAANIGELKSPLAVDVTAIGPQPMPPAPAEGAPDALADVPIEVAPAQGVADDVSPATRLPASHDPGRRLTRTHNLPLGRVTAIAAPFDLP